MIKDNSVAKEIKKDWSGVVALRDKFKAYITGAVGMGGTPVIFVADAAHNLPFIHACSVLNDTLFQLSKEGHFTCGSIFLGTLVAKAETHLYWNDYKLIEELVDKRNGIAHYGKIIPRADCWRYIDAIENQLRSWKVI